MYVDPSKCWAASMYTVQWKDVEKSLEENNKKLKEITEKEKTNLEISLEIVEKNNIKKAEENKELDNLNKSKRLLDISA